MYPMAIFKDSNKLHLIIELMLLTKVIYKWGEQIKQSSQQYRNAVTNPSYLAQYTVTRMFLFVIE